MAMIVPFDYDLAKEGWENGFCKIITRKGDEVTVIEWLSGYCDLEHTYPVVGFTINSGMPCHRSWTKEGRNHKSGEDNPYDLFIEVL